MTLYRVHLLIEHGTSAGMVWTRTERAAQRLVNKHRRADKGNDATVTTVSFATTKVGILSLLAAHASHPDNG